MTYVLSDIHGNTARFESIMRQINLQPTDTLFVLGDVIDRYPDGITILRRIMAMPNAKMLLGNHEYMMLNALTQPARHPENPWERNLPNRDLSLWYHNGGKVTHEYLKRIRKSVRQEIFEFLYALPLNFDVEVNGIKYKLVHGSPLENYEHSGRFYEDSTEFAVWERWTECDYVPEGFILVFGHTPTAHFHDENPLKIWHSDEAIGIDCGSGFPATDNKYLEQGRLACLRLDDMKEFYSEK